MKTFRFLVNSSQIVSILAKSMEEAVREAEMMFKNVKLISGS